MPNEKWKCPKCGTENELENIFCGDCGTKRPEIMPGMAERVLPKQANQETTSYEDIIQKGEPEKKDDKGVITGSENQRIKSEAEISRNKVKIVAIVSVLIAFLAILYSFNSQQQAKIAEKQRIEAEERAKIAEQQRIEAEELRKKWSSRSADAMTWKNAKNYCKHLREDGFTDWRLPNIDELRTLIKNNPKFESGGKCKLSEKNNCLSGGCSNGCASAGSDIAGYYSKFGDVDTVYLWSSSPYIADDGGVVQGIYWGIFFKNYVGAFYGFGTSHVRCVR